MSPGRTGRPGDPYGGDPGPVREPSGPRPRAGPGAGPAAADVTLVRVIIAALVLFTGAGVALYVAAWLLIPEDGVDRRPPGPHPLTRTMTRTGYQAGRRCARQSIDVSIVAGSVQLSRDGKIIRVHPIRHDRTRELGAFANPKGRPRRKNSATRTVA